ncbi:MAG: rod shape-determining protein MreD [Methylacidiphilales bacterium]|nr:rod shape-determining protein MreD [Candidatus Methylacidiphilales bacterium]NJR19025.1 rod shape-determining protein MreD [Calothrix sp. CSU_2_0]
MKTLAIWGKRRKNAPKPYSSSPRKSKQQPRKSKNTALIKIKPIAKWNPRTRQIVDYSLMFFTVFLCLMLLPNRLPGMELLGIGPNWLLIWVVAWSVKRNALQGALAGVILGFLQDAMTAMEPTHALSLGLVGFLTGLMQKQRFIQEDFISIALIVFAMSALGEAVFASQLVMMRDRNPTDIWAYYQRVALASSILSSLWAPVVYYPLNRWWQKLKLAEQN